MLMRERGKGGGGSDGTCVSWSVCGKETKQGGKEDETRRAVLAGTRRGEEPDQSVMSSSTFQSSNEPSGQTRRMSLCQLMVSEVRWARGGTRRPDAPGKYLRTTRGIFLAASSLMAISRGSDSVVMGTRTGAFMLGKARSERRGGQLRARHAAQTTTAETAVPAVSMPAASFLYTFAASLSLDDLPTSNELAGLT